MLCQFYSYERLSHYSTTADNGTRGQPDDSYLDVPGFAGLPAQVADSKQ
jgi:hypothetical protein